MIPIAVFFILLLYSAAMLPPHAVWITDNGNKFMIMQNFAENNTIFFDHASPENFHFCGFHFQKLADGRITSFHSPYFPVLAALCCKIIGSFGTMLIPFACAAGIAAFFCKFPIKRRIPAVLLVMLSTPLCFYSLLFWEMIPAAFCVTAAAWYFFRRRFTVAGIFLGTGLWMREELYLLGVCLLITLIFSKKWRIIRDMAVGAVLPIIMLWMSNFLLFGNIAGVHGASYFANNRPQTDLLTYGKEVIFNIYQHLIRFETLSGYSKFTALAAVSISLAAGSSPDYKRWKKFKLAAGTFFSIAAMIFAVGLWRDEQYLMVSAKTFGLFISIPLLVGILLNVRPLLCDRHMSIRIAAGTILLYILLIPFTLNPHDIGLTWGARHFIMLIPVMLLLSGYAFSKSGFMQCVCGKAIITLAAAAGIVMQSFALYAMVRVTQDTESIQNEILDLPFETVVSDLFFIPEMTPALPFAKEYLEISSDRQLACALDHMNDRRIGHFILILSPDYRRIENRQLAELLENYPAVTPPAAYTIGNSLRIWITICAKRQ